MNDQPVQSQYTIRRKLLTVFGAKFHILDANGRLIGFSRQKAFRLKEDIRVYTDESQSRELMSIMARNVIDFSAAYDVTDTSTGTKLGALRRRGLASLMRDEWIVLDSTDQQVGVLTEDSTAMALVRRFLPLGNLVPQNYRLRSGDGNVFAQYRTHFNPVIHKMSVAVESHCPISPHVVLAGGILLLAIEGRQRSS